MFNYRVITSLLTWFPKLRIVGKKSTWCLLVAHVSSSHGVGNQATTLQAIKAILAKQWSIDNVNTNTESFFFTYMYEHTKFFNTVAVVSLYSINNCTQKTHRMFLNNQCAIREHISLLRFNTERFLHSGSVVKSNQDL